MSDNEIPKRNFHVVPASHFGNGSGTYCIDPRELSTKELLRELARRLANKPPRKSLDGIDNPCADAYCGACALLSKFKPGQSIMMVIPPHTCGQQPMVTWSTTSSAGQTATLTTGR